ncbi:hypothetical protein N8650_02370 [Akkermansiaceae bacterium]|nr:hypothetical protein [Akkermansiaceae bacterium]
MPFHGSKLGKQKKRFIFMTQKWLLARMTPYKVSNKNKYYEDNSYDLDLPLSFFLMRLFWEKYPR